MSFSTLPLSYCTNVHPARNVPDVVAGLQQYTAPVQSRLGRPVAAGLWLAAAVVRELEQEPATLRNLQGELQELGLVCYTLNAFPYGDFHSDRVKEQVYLPDWSTGERLDYTAACARILAELLPDGTEGSLSTVPLGFKGFQHGDDFESSCIGRLLELAEQLDRLHDETGRVIRLAIEPEPCCILETTPETLRFFEHVWDAASQTGRSEIARRHLGVCYDVCHQSVEFEDVADSIARLEAARVRLNKIHITCAIRLPRPSDSSEGREALAHYVEARYLHQTLARLPNGTIRSELDLTPEFCASPPEEFATADEWRTHFHVPVNAESIGPLLTTRNDLRRALDAVRQLPYAPHLEVETYTWGVLPGTRQPSLVEGLTAELAATHELLAALG
ncbi:MAG: metabolite traffic protein EboE [Planctomycetaceae bacterium]|nr:metabolite traffic protein EboE [Planctomycetaceae bacterium]